MPSIFDPLNSMARTEHEQVERQERQTAYRLIGFRVVIVLAFIVLTGRLWDMQIIHSDSYVNKATENRVRERNVKALRGVIYDRNNRQLVTNQASFDIAVDVEDLASKDQPAVTARLATLLKVDAAQISAKIDQQRKTSPTVPVMIASSIDWPTLLQIKEEHVTLPGVIPIQSTIRDYADGPLFSGILGYVGPITAEEYPDLKTEGYTQDDKLGRAGVELTYQDDLRGVNGLQHVEVDSGGREVQVLDEVPPKSGNSLILTIDSAFQKDVSTYLRWGMDRAHCYQANPDSKEWTSLCPADVKAKMAKPVVDGGHGDEGAAIVMDIHTGEVLALVGFPQYDNNVFTGRAIDQDKAAAVLTSHDNPLIDRALSASAPGSTFKQVTAAAALQEHVVTPTTGFPVGACWPTIRFCNWDSKGYGNMNVVDAIAQSNDIWMASVVAGSGLIRGIGPDKLAWYAQQFGIGAQVGIDLPFEQKGLAPTTAWKAANFTGDDKQWYEGNSLNVAIGQGDDLATPLQMLDVTATVANNGNLMVPHVVRQVLDAQGKVVRTIQPEVKSKVPVDQQYLEAIRHGMRQGVINGSSVAGNLHELKIAGKTGTAEFVAIGPDGKPERDKQGHLPNNAWWVGFAPYDDPQIAVVVWVHDAGEGSAFALPVARKIMARYFHLSDVRNPFGCDTPQTTPGPCAGYEASVRTQYIYTDETQRETKAEDFHDPTFPMPKDITSPSPSAAPSARPSR